MDDLDFYDSLSKTSGAREFFGKGVEGLKDFASKNRHAIIGGAAGGALATGAGALAVKRFGKKPSFIEQEAEAYRRWNERERDELKAKGKKPGFSHKMSKVVAKAVGGAGKAMAEHPVAGSFTIGGMGAELGAEIGARVAQSMAKAAGVTAMGKVVPKPPTPKPAPPALDKMKKSVDEMKKKVKEHLASADPVTIAEQWGRELAQEDLEKTAIALNMGAIGGALRAGAGKLMTAARPIAQRVAGSTTGQAAGFGAALGAGKNIIQHFNKPKDQRGSLLATAAMGAGGGALGGMAARFGAQKLTAPGAAAAGKAAPKLIATGRVPAARQTVNVPQMPLA